MKGEDLLNFIGGELDSHPSVFVSLRRLQEYQRKQVEGSRPVRIAQAPLLVQKFRQPLVVTQELLALEVVEMFIAGGFELVINFAQCLSAGAVSFPLGSHEKRIGIAAIFDEHDGHLGMRLAQDFDARLCAGRHVGGVWDLRQFSTSGMDRTDSVASNAAADTLELDLVQIGEDRSINNKQWRGTIYDIRLYDYAVPDRLLREMYDINTRWDLYWQPKVMVPVPVGIAAVAAAGHGKLFSRERNRLVTHL